MEIRLLIAESTTLVRQGLAHLLSSDPEISVVGEATTGMQAVEKARDLSPDAVIVNRQLAGLDGIAATRLISQESPASKVIVLSFANETDEEEVLEAVRAGARGYVNLTISSSHLIQHIKQVALGGVALTEETTRKLLDSLARGTPRRSDNEPDTLLTEREKCVLNSLSQGARNKEIASALIISENTVRAHVRTLMQKLNVDNRTQLAIYGVKYGFGLQRQKATAPARSGQPEPFVPSFRNGQPTAPPQVGPGRVTPFNSSSSLRAASF